MPCTMHNASPFEITQAFNHIGERRRWPATPSLRTGRTTRQLLLDAMHAMRPQAKKRILEGSTTGKRGFTLTQTIFVPRDFLDDTIVYTSGISHCNIFAGL